MEQQTDRLIAAATAIVLGLTMYAGAKAAFPTVTSGLEDKPASVLKQAKMSVVTDKIGFSTEKAPDKITNLSDIPSGTIVKEEINTIFIDFNKGTRSFDDNKKSTISGVDNYYYDTSSNNGVVMGIYNDDGTLVKSKSTDYGADTNALTNLDDNTNYILVLNVVTDVDIDGNNAVGKKALVFYKANGAQIKNFLQSFVSDNYTFNLNRQNFFTEDTELSDSELLTTNHIYNIAPTSKSLVKFYNAYGGVNDKSAYN